MLSLINRALEPASSNPDRITYLTSVQLYQSFRTDNIAIVEKIADLISSINTRLLGFQVLEIALQQNPDILLKRRWMVAVRETLFEADGAHALKEHACRILCLLIPLMSNAAKERQANHNDNDIRILAELFPFFIQKIDENVEWTKGACKCLLTTMKYFPYLVNPDSRGKLMDTILNKVSYCVSSRTFEFFADLFCEIPNCCKAKDSEEYGRIWSDHYCTKMIITLHSILNNFLSFIMDEPYADDVIIPKVKPLHIEEDEADRELFPSYMKNVRRVVNLCKCLAKLLSTKTRYNVRCPVKLLLQVLFPLFQIQEKIKAVSQELQIICSALAQMQMAALSVIEAIFLNFDLMLFSGVIPNLMCSALQASKLSVFNETVSQVRYGVWKLVKIWLDKNGTKAANDVGNHSVLMEELLKDICVDEVGSMQTISKTKKNTSFSTGPKNYIINKMQQSACKEALKCFETLIYTGAYSLSKNGIQDINSKVFEIAYALHPSNYSFPFPYDDDSCRKSLYSVLLAIVVTSKPEQKEAVHSAIGIFKNAMKDPSYKVTRLSHRAVATIKHYTHPKRASPVYTDTLTKPLEKLREWASDEYVTDLPEEVKPEVSENVVQEQSFENETKVSKEESFEEMEVMEVETNYQEQSIESQCNGEEISEMQSSSQCQDDIDSEDEEEDEEDEERSYGEEEIQQESMYIPTTSKSQVLNPIHIDPETVQTVGESEFEEMRHCAKTEGVVIDNSDNDVHLNGEENLVPDEEVPSSSTHTTVTNENGIYGPEDEELEEEEVDEEEEEHAKFPAEKRVPEIYDQPVKKQKLDNDEEKEIIQNEETENKVHSPSSPKSPSLAEMKADLFNNAEVKS